MAGASTPTPQDAARALNRLTPDQFAQVCSEIGYPEVTLPGATQAARAAALVEKTKGRPDFAALVRAINRVDPQAWRAVPARAAVSSLVYGLIAFVALLGIGGLALVLILSGAESTAELPPTPTETLAPTRTPVPTLTYTPPPTSVPSDTPTSSATSTPTRDPALASATRRPTATDTVSPTPLVSVIYPRVEPLRPHSGYSAYPGTTVEFRWILRDVTPAPDEQYLMRLYDADRKSVV